MKTKILNKTIYYVIVAAIVVVFIYPFWWMVTNSLNSINEIFGKPTLLPKSWMWQNYIEIFRVQPFARHYLNTIIVALLGTGGNVLVSALSGYAFARLRFPGRSALFVLLLTALMMPIEVTIVPMYFMMNSIGANDTLVPLILIPVFCSQGAFSAACGNLFPYHAAYIRTCIGFCRYPCIPFGMEYVS